ncbi:hypothetical protein AVEN_120442-1, partial [Araneus ventricosus]
RIEQVDRNNRLEEWRGVQSRRIPASQRLQHHPDPADRQRAGLRARRPALPEQDAADDGPLLPPHPPARLLPRPTPLDGQAEDLGIRQGRVLHGAEILDLPSCNTFSSGYLGHFSHFR